MINVTNDRYITVILLSVTNFVWIINWPECFGEIRLDWEMRLEKESRTDWCLGIIENVIHESLCCLSNHLCRRWT